MIMQDNEKKPALRFKGFTDPWEQRKLGELSRSFEYGLNAAAKEYDGQNKYLRITDIDDTSRQFVSADITSPDANLAEADNYRLSDGDVLFARTGASVGKTYLYKKSDGLVYFAGFLIRAKIKESVSAGFIFQNTLTRSYERYIAITSQRSGQPGVNAQEYAEYQLMLPELFEQEKIAKLLEALDTLITLHQRKYEKLVNIKKSMLDKMFPQNGASVPEIRFKSFTDPWEQRKLDEAFDFTVPNNTLSRAELNQESGSVRNVHYGDVLIKYGSVLDAQNDELPFITGRSKDDFKGALLQNGDIIIADTAEDETTGKVCEIVNIQDKDVVAGLHTMVCRPKNKTAEGYFGYYMNSSSYHHQLLPLMQGIKVLSLSKTNVQKTTVKYPKDKAEQQKIADCLRRIDTLITLHQRKLEKLQNIKKSCLEKMFV